MPKEQLALDASPADAAVLLQEAERPAKPLDAKTISKMNSWQLRELIGPKGTIEVGALRDWLLVEARRAEDPSKSLTELSNRLLALGVPIERVALSISTLHAEHDAVGRIWLKDGGVKESVYVSPGPDDPTFLRSPYYAALTSREWVEMRLAETPDDRFGIVPDLKAEGYTHYICAPITFANEMTAWVTLATRAPDGFSARALAIIASILPPFSVLLELRVAWGTLRNVLRIYVGDEPRQAILRGNVKRGQVSTIRSAILFADMRDSTQQTVELGAVGAVELFNNFFDCLVPAIEQRHGEVLKYLGDGLLAIFREAKDGDCDAPERALFAARDSLASLNAFNTEHPDRPQMRAGIALHYGEAAYGNIGSGTRLDFTVIGRDVSLASRIADMNRTLDEPLLMSAAFARELGQKVRPLGKFPAKGFVDPVEIFRPDVIDVTLDRVYRTPKTTFFDIG
ncbi:MAG: adenylate/guanylate cyclase domain-containing protein [Beijerinckiaceae bacterium]|jgi:adenylate cyclase